MLCVPQDWWTVTEEDGPGLMGGLMGVLCGGGEEKAGLRFHSHLTPFSAPASAD